MIENVGRNDPITAAKQNEIIDAINAQGAVVGSNAEVLGPLSRRPPNHVFHAKLTSEDAGKYAWQEMRIKYNSGAYTYFVDPGGRSGTTSNKAAREINDTKGLLGDVETLMVVMVETYSLENIANYRFVASGRSHVTGTGEGGEGGVLLDKWIEVDPACTSGILCRTCYLEEKDEADEYILVDWRGRQIWCELAGYWSNVPGSNPNKYAWTLITGSKHVIGCTWDPGRGASTWEDDLLLGQLDLTQGTQTIRGRVYLEAGSGRLYFMTAGAGNETELADFRAIVRGSGRLCEPNHVCACLEDCSTCACDESGLNNVTVSSTVTCVSDAYSSGYGSGGQWTWIGGYCDGNGPWGTVTDFSLYTECKTDGTWTVKIIAYAAYGACFLLANIEAGAEAGEITCVDGQFTGSVTLAGQDTTGDGGPDLTGETATVVF